MAATEDTALIAYAVAYVIELFRELTEENGAPALGTQNQVVDFILADAELRKGWQSGAARPKPTRRRRNRRTGCRTIRRTGAFAATCNRSWSSRYSPDRARLPAFAADFRGRRVISSKSPSAKEAAVPSFDIVSRIDVAEVDNALAAIKREIGTRFDFKGSKCSIERQDGVLSIVADDELKLKQMHELLKVHLTRRKVDPAALEYKTPEKASGNTLRQAIIVRQGVDANLAKQLIREIKDSKLKVQVSIQGDELRVTGKKRDDLQAAIALARGLKVEQPLQYVNFRD